MSEVMVKDNQRRSPVSSVPDEVLDLILTAVQSIDIKYLARSVRVSRRWYLVGTKLLWLNVVLNYAEISTFCKCIEVNLPVPQFRRSLVDSRLRNLTVHGSIEAERFSFQHTAQSHRTLHDLSRILPKLSGLQSFSFNHSNTTADPWSLDQMTDEIVVSLVEELPASLQHLEINCPTVYFRRDPSAPCLCALISDRLAGLYSLRLSWPRLCPQLLRAASPTLSYAVIDACKSDLRAGLKPCGAEDQIHMSWDQVQARMGNQCRRAIATFVTALKEKCAIREHYPMLKQFTVLEPYHFWPQHSHHQWFLLNVHSIKEIDSSSYVNSLSTTCYPIWPTGFINEALDASNQFSFILRTCIHEACHDTVTSREHDCSSQDRIGGKEAICNILEGKATWTSDNLHSRRPCHILDNASLTIPYILKKSEWEATYRNHRRKVLRENNEMTFFHHDPDIVSSLTLEGLQLFHSTHGVKAKEAGADYVWWLEKKLGQNVLWACQFPGGIYSLDAGGQVVDLIQPDCFTTYKAEIEKVQTDIIFDEVVTE